LSLTIQPAVERNISAIFQAAVPAGQLNNVGGQPLLSVWPRRNAPLASNVVDAGAAARGT
jgi:hypothetical protein